MVILRTSSITCNWDVFCYLIYIASVTKKLTNDKRRGWDSNPYPSNVGSTIKY